MTGSPPASALRASAVIATTIALRDAGLTESELESGTVGLAYGSTNGSSQANEEWCRKLMAQSGFLGMTVTCARCHDHKFDPTPSADYYSLYGVFRSSAEPGELPLIEEPDPNDPVYQDYLNVLAQKEQEVDKYIAEQRAELTKHAHEKTGDYLLGAHLGIVRQRGEVARVRPTVSAAAGAAVVGRAVRVVHRARAVAEDHHHLGEVPHHAHALERRLHPRGALGERQLPALLDRVEAGARRGEDRSGRGLARPTGGAGKQHLRDERKRRQEADHRREHHAPAERAGAAEEERIAETDVDLGGVGLAQVDFSSRDVTTRGRRDRARRLQDVGTFP